MRNRGTTIRRAVRRGAINLVEMTIVMIIIAATGAVAIPRMSRGATGVGDAPLKRDLATLRSALDRYQLQHAGHYPDAAGIIAALTQYSDLEGHTRLTASRACPFGPYLVNIPALPIGQFNGATGIDQSENATGSGVGWIYDPANGSIRANTTPDETDLRGVPYNAY